MVPIFLAGKLLDVVGRRKGAAILFTITVVSTVTSYTLESFWALVVSLTFAIIGATAVLPVLTAYNAELFPTELRGDAYAWANNLLGRWAYVGSPLLVGFVAADFGWSTAVAATAVLPAIALALILATFPETSNRELEETALTH